MEAQAGSEAGHQKHVVGWALFFQQTRALLAKNALLAWRNKASTFLQLFASFFFIFLIFCVDRAVRASLSGLSTFQNVLNPTPTPVPPIPACSTGYYMLPDCYDFVWSGNTSSLVVSLVQNISNNNPGRPINFATQTLGFASSDDVDTWLLANPYLTTGALLFSFTESGALGFGLQTNSTAKSQRGKFEDRTFTYQVPLQAAAERELARHLAQDWSIEWTPSYSEFAHPATTLLNVVAQAGSVFLFAASMFNFVIQMSNIVTEKETRVRQAMNTMGLMDSVYWLTWTLWEVGLAVVSCLLLVCFGLMFQFDFFLHNSFIALFLLFFLFWICMTSVAFLVSTFLKKSASANTIGFFIFIIGFILQLVVVFGFPYSSEFSKVYQVLFSLFPPDLLAIGLKYLGDATATPEDPGISTAGIASCAPRNDNCTLTLAGVYLWLLVLFFVYLVLALYFDNIMPDVNGVRKHCFFFLAPSFWTGRASNSNNNAGCFSCFGSPPAPEPTGASSEDEDVAEEERRVRAEVEKEHAHGLSEQDEAAKGGSEADMAVSVRGLVKTFPGRMGCFKKGTPPFHAIKGSWFVVEKEKLLCLLGPNGAGKSTTINCLTGILPVTSGDALIYGNSIRSPASMTAIRRSMGVCPQFDVLWDRLSGVEHLYLYARIKGIPSAHVPKEVTTLLEEVKLTDSGAVRTGSYSGGMKRRLSVAVALIGDPSIVFLDEPTTGMDPISRRYVWDIIERAKAGRAIVLTTHSMEEADILGDRIAIMAKGRLRCLGTSIHLKNRFGSGIVVTVGTASASASALANGNSGHDGGSVGPTADAAKAAVKQFFFERLGLAPTDESRSYLKFAIPQPNEDDPEAHRSLTDFFAALRGSKSELGITDVQLSLTTLEQVFLSIARQAELETAAAEGRYDTIVLPTGVTIKVPIGAERVWVPWQDGAESVHGMEMELTWQQDDTGTLRISHHSDPHPAPAVPAAVSSDPSAPMIASAHHRSWWAKQQTVTAVALDQGADS